MPDDNRNDKAVGRRDAFLAATGASVAGIGLGSLLGGRNAFARDMEGRETERAISVVDTTALGEMGTDHLVNGSIAFVAANGGSYWCWYPTGSTPPVGCTQVAGNGGAWAQAPLLPVTATQAAQETVVVHEIRPSGSVPPFTWQMGSTLARGTYDNVLSWGYNVSGSGMRAYQSIESAYEAFPGAIQSEMHWEFYNSAWGTGIYRPLSASCQYASGLQVLLLQFADGLDSTQGFIQIVEQSTGSQQVKILNGGMILQPDNYGIAASNGLTIENNQPPSSANPIYIKGDASLGTYLEINSQTSSFLVRTNGGMRALFGSQTILFSSPLGGDNSAFQLTNNVTTVGTSQDLGHGGETALIAAVYSCPVILITDSGLTSPATVVFPTTTGPTEWTMDLTGVAFGGQTVALEVGTSRKTLIVDVPSVLRVYSDGVGSLYALTFA